jgi:hypothetical protein
MSDKVELIASAQVNVSGTTISFNSNYGFKSASRTSAGLYVLELEHKHGVDKQVVNVTRNNTAFGEIEATVIDDRHIQINNFSFDEAPAAADSPFFITVFRVRD